jgi:hypothetical protein
MQLNIHFDCCFPPLYLVPGALMHIFECVEPWTGIRKGAVGEFIALLSVQGLGYKVFHRSFCPSL